LNKYDGKIKIKNRIIDIIENSLNLLKLFIFLNKNAKNKKKQLNKKENLAKKAFDKKIKNKM
tara:strand:- start:24 stop:209 length:186 start_codon:yes stop_codon:yes gene_type:complete